MQLLDCDVEPDTWWLVSSESPAILKLFIQHFIMHLIKMVKSTTAHFKDSMWKSLKLWKWDMHYEIGGNIHNPASTQLIWDLLSPSLHPSSTVAHDCGFLLSFASWGHPSCWACSSVTFIITLLTPAVWVVILRDHQTSQLFFLIVYLYVKTCISFYFFFTLRKISQRYFLTWHYLHFYFSFSCSYLHLSLSALSMKIIPHVETAEASHFNFIT